ncbi:MAG: type II secretion system protein, partial [Lachnospiraceae bacterium]|nr:type II secretion system protein [Lachnospiraceae bacterium]
MKKLRNNSGFSMVELIVVIAIMAVLVGLLAPQFIKYVER